MAMNLWFYVTEPERDALIEFIRGIDGLHVLPGLPGGESGLAPDDIRRSDARYLSYVPADQVAVQVRETQIGTVRSWDPTQTPLIEWKVPYQRDKLIIGGSMRLVEHRRMEPHQELRQDYLATRKMMKLIKSFMAERFVQIDASLFNAAEAIQLMDNGYSGLPLDPETTELVTVRGGVETSSRSEPGLWDRFMKGLGIGS